MLLFSLVLDLMLFLGTMW